MSCRSSENLLDLVADTTLAIDAAPATAKIRTRLARLQTQRKHLQERLTYFAVEALRTGLVGGPDRQSTRASTGGTAWSALRTGRVRYATRTAAVGSPAAQGTDLDEMRRPGRLARTAS